MFTQATHGTARASTPPSALKRYGLALLASALAYALTLALRPVMTHSVLIAFAGAVMLSAWYGGLGPGLVSAAVGALGADYLFLGAAGASVSLVERALRLALFGVTAVVISSLTASLHRAREEAQRHAAELRRQADALERQTEEEQLLREEAQTLAEELEQTNTDLRAATAEAESANRDLVRLAAEAEAANRAKSEFLAVMSHELRTPLNAILGYSQLLELGLHGPVTEAQREALWRIGHNQRRLLSLVTGILDYAKLEAGHVRLEVRDVPVRDVLAGVEDAVMLQARAKGLRYACCPSCATVAARADPERVQQILLNLLSNAVKFTNRGGAIDVRCESLDRRVAIRVRDTGIGIPPDKLESVFQPFVQVEQGLTRSAEGTGLGLAISRDLARAMGGDLTVESAPGHGSTFTLTLPVGSLPRAAADAAPAGGAPRRREAPPLRRGALALASDALTRESEDVADALARRLRADPLVPRAAATQQLELKDHIATFLTDVANSLNVFAERGDDPSHLLRDGVDLQRLLSERHGAQRARLGWTEAALAREFEVLREEVEAAVRRQVSERGHMDDADVGDALGLLRRILEQAERVSFGGFRSLAAPGAPAARAAPRPGSVRAEGSDASPR